MSILKKTCKTLLSIALSVMMTIALLPNFTADILAATSGNVEGLSDGTIGLTFKGDGIDPWTAEGTSIDGTVISEKKGIRSYYYSSTLTMTNNRRTSATLSFDFELELNDGTYKINNEVIEGGKFSKDLAPGESVTVYIKAYTKAIDRTTSIHITNVLLEGAQGNIKTIFTPSENGTYTLNEEEVTEEVTKEQGASVAYKVVATPAEGYKFLGWYDSESDSFLSKDASTDLYVDSDAKVTAVFTEIASPLFETAGVNFDDLGKAIEYAQRKNAVKITLVDNGTITGNYTIPVGITLLIPFDEAGTCYTTEPGVDGTDLKTPKAFRTLNMATGSSITVEGGLSISAKHMAAGGGSGNTTKIGVTGPYGLIQMATGSNITIASTGNLYAWGFITGSGTVTAKSGSHSYELFQIADFRGGSNSANAAAINSFPLTQYYVQNVEVLMTYEAGAIEQVYATLYASLIYAGTGVDFVGPTGLFNVKSGTFSKIYNPSTDRMDFTINGNAELNSLALSLSGANIDSKDFFLPISNNISLSIESGTTTCNQDISLLPGVVIDVKEGATLHIPEGHAAIVYDEDDWKQGHYALSAYFVPSAYTPTRTYNRNNGDLIDAKLIVDGTLKVDGFIYSTSFGGDICSTGSGSIELNGGADEGGVQYHIHNNLYDPLILHIDAQEVEYFPALLHNDPKYYGDDENKEFEFTDWAEPGDVYNYDSKRGCWVLGDVVECEHEETEIRDAKEATCTEAGYTGDTYCKDCDEKLEEGQAIEPLGHDYQEAITKQATCEEDGEKTSTCTRCNDIKTEVIPATGHTVVTDASKAATCTTSGLTEGSHCSVCGNTIQEQEVIDALGHDWDEGVTTDSTCNEDGSIVYTCNRCADTKSEVINKKGHATVIDKAVAPTCTTDGLTEGSHCSRCGDIIVEQEVVSALGHDYGEWKVTKAPTCTEDGEETRKCSRCDAKETRSLAALGHTEVVDEAVLATCTEDGLTVGKHCSVCNEVLVKQEKVEKLGHKEVVDEGKEATCTEDGITEGKHCERCDEVLVKQEKIEAKGHKEVVIPGEAATCTTYGKTEGKYCSVCGDMLVAPEGIEPLGHNYVDHVCSRCGDVQLHGWVTDKVGTTYYVDGEQPYFDTWATIEEKDYYFNPEGYIVKGVVTVEDKAYLFDSETGEWLKEFNGTTVVDDKAYLVENGICTQIENGWNTINGVTIYYFKDTNELAKDGIFWLAYPEGYTPDAYDKEESAEYVEKGYDKNSYFIFNEDGTFQKDINGKYTVKAGTAVVGGPAQEVSADFTAWAVNGEITWRPGLVEYQGDYYYFSTAAFETGKGFVAGRDYTISKTNNLAWPASAGWGEGTFVSGKYTFDTDGKLQLFDGLTDIGSNTYYYVHGVKTYAGLIELDGDYYYINSSCTVVKNREYNVSKTNGLLPAGTYAFDKDGKMIREEESLNGIVKDGDTWTYYVDGVKTYAGLIQIDGDYYYVNSSFQVIHGRSYFVSKNNDLLPQGTYEFDKDGKLVLEKKEGIVKEADGWFYYVDGIKTYAGLIKINGDYYYVKSDKTVVHDRSYFVSKTNGLLPQGTYTFDKDGKLVTEKPEDKKNGIVKDGDVWTYYVDGVATYAGLIKIDGSYYYVKTDKTVIHGRDYFVSKTNDLLPQGTYTFDAEGKIVFPETKEDEKEEVLNGIVKDGDVWTYYVDGVATYAGLIQIDGDYYYVKTDKTVIHGRDYFVSKTNDLLPAGTYTFGEDGKLVLPKN